MRNRETPWGPGHGLQTILGARSKYGHGFLGASELLGKRFRRPEQGLAIESGVQGKVWQPAWAQGQGMATDSGWPVQGLTTISGSQ